jgi:hypothetical protein
VKLFIHHTEYASVESPYACELRITENQISLFAVYVFTRRCILSEIECRLTSDLHLCA